MSLIFKKNPLHSFSSNSKETSENPSWNQRSRLSMPHYTESQSISKFSFSLTFSSENAGQPQNHPNQRKWHSKHLHDGRTNSTNTSRSLSLTHLILPYFLSTSVRHTFSMRSKRGTEADCERQKACCASQQSTRWSDGLAWLAEPLILGGDGTHISARPGTRLLRHTVKNITSFI